MIKYKLNDAVLHRFVANNAHPYCGDVRELKVFDELISNLNTPTNLLATLARRYDASSEDLMRATPILASRANSGYQALERVFENNEISYVEYTNHVIKPYHALDYVVGNLTALTYVKLALNGVPEDLTKAVVYGQVAEYVHDGDFTRGNARLSRAVMRTRLYLLSELNTIVPAIKPEGVEAKKEVKKYDKKSSKPFL